MSRTVIAHEIRNLFRERVIVAAGVLFVVALLVGLATSTSISKRHESMRAAVQEMNDQHLRTMRGQLEAVAAGRKPEGFFWANLPIALRYQAPRVTSPLMAITLGQSEYFPSSATIKLQTPEPALFEAASIDNPDHQQIGRFDVSFVLVYLLPLLLIALGYSVLSIERERGTLPLLMSQPLSLWRLLLSKAIVPLVVLLIPAIALPIAWTLAVRPESAALWPNLLFFAVLVTGYACFWIALALAVNLLGWRSSTNALVLGGFWLTFVLVLPAALQATVTTLHPMPSRLDLVSRARLAEVESGQKQTAITDAFYKDHPELIPPDKKNRFLAVYALSMESERAVAPLYQRFDEQLEAQQGLIRRMQFFSPAVILHESLTSLTGTGREGFQTFRQDVLSLRDEMRAFVLPRLAKNHEMTLADYDAAPVFRASLPATSLPWSGLGGLLFPTLALGLWARRRAGRVELMVFKS
jgi:ABC-2 type transport system permease protein